MRPQKRLKVLGMRVVVFTRKSTPLAVVTYTAWAWERRGGPLSVRGSCAYNTGCALKGARAQRREPCVEAAAKSRCRAFTLPALFRGLSRIVSSACLRGSATKCSHQAEQGGLARPHVADSLQCVLPAGSRRPPPLRAWCRMSGLYSAGSRLCLRR